jgi:hypothetical protein
MAAFQKLLLGMVSRGGRRGHFIGHRNIRSGGQQPPLLISFIRSGGLLPPLRINFIRSGGLIPPLLIEPIRSGR